MLRSLCVLCNLWSRLCCPPLRSAPRSAPSSVCVWGSLWLQVLEELKLKPPPYEAMEGAEAVPGAPAGSEAGEPTGAPMQAPPVVPEMERGP